MLRVLLVKVFKYQQCTSFRRELFNNDAPVHGQSPIYTITRFQPKCLYNNYWSEEIILSSCVQIEFKYLVFLMLSNASSTRAQHQGPHVNSAFGRRRLRADTELALARAVLQVDWTRCRPTGAANNFNGSMGGTSEMLERGGWKVNFLSIYLSLPVLFFRLLFNKWFFFIWIGTDCQWELEQKQFYL